MELCRLDVCTGRALVKCVSDAQMCKPASLAILPLPSLLLHHAPCDLFILSSCICFLF